MKNLLFVILFIISTPLLASSQTGKVKQLYVRDSDGLVYFTLDTASPADKPACATKVYWMIKDENSETGKKQYSLLLTAQAAQKRITVIGYGTCTRWGDGEDVNSLSLNP